MTLCCCGLISADHQYAAEGHEFGNTLQLSTLKQHRVVTFSPAQEDSFSSCSVHYPWILRLNRIALLSFSHNARPPRYEQLIVERSTMKQWLRKLLRLPLSFLLCTALYPALLWAKPTIDVSLQASFATPPFLLELLYACPKCQLRLKM